MTLQKTIAARIVPMHFSVFPAVAIQ